MGSTTAARYDDFNADVDLNRVIVGWNEGATGTGYQSWPHSTVTVSLGLQASVHEATTVSELATAIRANLVVATLEATATSETPLVSPPA